MTRPPLSPHVPMLLTMQGLGSKPMITLQVKIKVFPARRPIGCDRQPRPVEWPWRFEAVEKQLCDIHNMPETELQRYTGRSAGFRIAKVPIQQVHRQDACRKMPREVHAWKAAVAMSH